MHPLLLWASSYTFFLFGALDFISFYKALILRKDERRRGIKDEEKKELNLALTAWPSDTIRKFKNTRGISCGAGGGSKSFISLAVPILSPSLF